MFGSFQLLGHFVDLDSPWVSQVHFDLMSPEEFEGLRGDAGEPTWDSCFVWFAAILRFALESRATVLNLRREREAERLCQSVFVPPNEDSEDREWLELVPMPWSPRDAGIRAVRMVAFMMPWSKRGRIHYRYKGKRCKARCVQESADDLVIYFTADRPALRRLAPEPLATG